MTDKSFVSVAATTEYALPVWSIPGDAQKPSTPSLRVAEVVSALSYSLDLATGQPVGHSVRSCLLGMRLGQEIGLAPDALGALYYALLLKDGGCSSNASKTFHAFGSDDIKAKRDVKTTDWTKTSWETLQYVLSHVAPGKPFMERMKAIARIAATSKQHARETTKIRCERGATLARLIGLPEATAEGIASLDEHWDGQGNPEGLRKTEIPLLSRIMLLAQTLEVFYVQQGSNAAVEVAVQRRKTWFDPDLVRAVQKLAGQNKLFQNLRDDDVFRLVVDLDPQQQTMSEGDRTLDAICMAFAQVVDAKSPFTFRHSNGVANAAVAIARMLQLSPSRVVFVRHAALLHDLGKMSVSNAILEKPAKLDDAEWQIMRLHPYYTWKVLNCISGFEELSEVAASHHEKLDGSGYFRGFKAEQLPLEARILAVADIFDALAAKRPYRDALPLETVFNIMRKDAPRALDAECVEALQQSGVDSDQAFVDLESLQLEIDRANLKPAPREV